VTELLSRKNSDGRWAADYAGKQLIQTGPEVLSVAGYGSGILTSDRISSRIEARRQVDERENTIQATATILPFNAYSKSYPLSDFNKKNFWVLSKQNADSSFGNSRARWRPTVTPLTCEVNASTDITNKALAYLLNNGMQTGGTERQTALAVDAIYKE
jgi:hypothetical protein